ncbi:TPA: hypothetical protein ACGBG5_003476 [Enterococcus faecalis]
MTTEITTKNSSMDMIMDANLEKVTQQLQAIANFQTVVQNNLKSGQDFGVIPGTNKPTLLKPGAEKIQMLFGVTSEYEEIERIQDYDKGFFAYTIKCTLSKNGQKITEGMGHCNTKEKKYIKQDPFTLANTCLKMAKKRAQIDATLTIASLSEVFTQDMEDLQDFAKREQMETMNTGDAAKMKVTFGKHKGKTLGEIKKGDQGYLEWLKEEAKDDALKQAAAMVLAETHSTNDYANKPTIERAGEHQLEVIEQFIQTISQKQGVSEEEFMNEHQLGGYKNYNKEQAERCIAYLKGMELPAEQENLFDAMNPPIEGTEIDIPEDELPF